MSFRLLFKIVVVGDGGVGKSTMIQRLTTGYFIPMRITIGTDLLSYDVPISTSEKVKLQIWDFGGEKRFRFFLPNYCRGATGCLLCYDITRFKSLDSLEEWYNIVKNVAKNPVLVLVGCKKDLAEEKRVIEVDTAKRFKDKYDVDYYFECSSKTGENIKDIFEILTKAIIERNKLMNG